MPFGVPSHAGVPGPREGGSAPNPAGGSLPCMLACQVRLNHTLL